MSKDIYISTFSSKTAAIYIQRERHIYIYIYIYRERDRERYRDIERYRQRQQLAATFNPNNKNAFTLTQTAFKLLQQSCETKQCFKDIKLIKSQRQPSTLKKILTWVKYSNEKEHYSKKCTKPRYNCCDYNKEDSFDTFRTTGDIFYPKESMTCERSDLVYVFICSTCNKEYIEETGEGKTRVWVYRQHKRQPHYRQLKCKEHFRTCENGEVKIFPFFKLHSYNKYFREKYAEYFWDKFKDIINPYNCLLKNANFSVITRNE